MKIGTLILFTLLLVLNSCKRDNTVKMEYNADGKLYKKTVYVSPGDKSKYREYEYFDNENIKELTEYTKGIRQGRSFSYYENGTIKSVYYYDNGKLNSIGRYYDETGRLTDKGLFINDSLVAKQEYFYNNNLTRVNAFSKNTGEFKEEGSLLYNDKGLFGLDNSFYYITSSVDSIPMGDSIKIDVNFITHKNKNAHIALTLGRLDENLQFTGRYGAPKSDSLSLSFFYKPDRKGYNLILGKLIIYNG